MFFLAALASCSSSDSGPVTIDIGSNDPSVVVAFGDSITAGFGSSDGTGYRDDLERHFAADGRSGIRVIDESNPGTFSSAGVGRIGSVLAADKPAVLILLYGTNDEFAGLPMQVREAAPGTTTWNLLQIINAARANQTIVVVSTIPPVCLESRAFQRANIEAMNTRIRDLVSGLHASDDGVLLADAWDAFLDDGSPDGCSLINLESGNHPNDAGYAVLAKTYYEALSDVRW